MYIEQPDSGQWTEVQASYLRRLCQAMYQMQAETVRLQNDIEQLKKSVQENVFA